MSEAEAKGDGRDEIDPWLLFFAGIAQGSIYRLAALLDAKRFAEARALCGDLIRQFEMHRTRRERGG